MLSCLTGRREVLCASRLLRSFDLDLLYRLAACSHVGDAGNDGQFDLGQSRKARLTGGQLSFDRLPFTGNYRTMEAFVE